MLIQIQKLKFLQLKHILKKIINFKILLMIHWLKSKIFCHKKYNYNNYNNENNNIK